MEIRRYTESDWPGVWPIVHEVIEGGDTYEYPPGSSEPDGRRLWIRPEPGEVWLAVDGDQVLGTYKIGANRMGLADHVANGSYMVAGSARGRGVGRALGEHSLSRVKELGFAAMQFNCVVAVNTPAVRLWRSLGFLIVGTVPDGFRHPRYGLVDFHVMHRFV